MSRKRCHSSSRKDENLYCGIEWTKQRTLEFIQDYRINRVLWDPTRKSFNRNQRLKAVVDLSEKYNCSVEFIRNKIKCLRSSFHREQAKFCQRQECGNPYEPLWFAFEHMKFILNSQLPSKTEPADDTMDSLSDQFLNYDCLEIKSEDDIVASTHNDADSNCVYNNMNPKTPESEPDLKCFVSNVVCVNNDDDDDDDDDRPALTRPTYERCVTNRNEFTIFGEHVAVTLKRLKTDNGRIVAKHLINNILFEAEMGKFDNGPVSNRNQSNCSILSNQF